MQFHRVDVCGTLALKAIDDSLVPAVVPGFGRVVGVTRGRGASLSSLPLGDLAGRQVDRLHAVHQDRILVPLLARTLISLVPCRDDPAGNVIDSLGASQSSHPFLGLLAVHRSWRLVSGRPGPAQHVQVATEL